MSYQVLVCRDRHAGWFSHVDVSEQQGPWGITGSPHRTRARVVEMLEGFADYYDTEGLQIEHSQLYVDEVREERFRHGSPVVRMGLSASSVTGPANVKCTACNTPRSRISNYEGVVPSPGRTHRCKSCDATFTVRALKPESFAGYREYVRRATLGLVIEHGGDLPALDVASRTSVLNAAHLVAKTRGRVDVHTETQRAWYYRDEKLTIRSVSDIGNGWAIVASVNVALPTGLELVFLGNAGSPAPNAVNGQLRPGLWLRHLETLYDDVRTELGLMPGPAGDPHLDGPVDDAAVFGVAGQ